MQNLRSQRDRKLVSLYLLIGLTVAIGIFIYLVSPLRDPAFQPNSANAGSLLPWLRGISEADWLGLATFLAGILASNVTALAGRSRRTLQGWRRASDLLLWLTSWLFLFGVLWSGFIGYLFAQWLID